MSRRRVFVVTRATGMYSDRRENDVIAFTEENDAKKLVADLKAWFAAHPRPDFGDVYGDEGITRKTMRGHICPLDPEHFDDAQLEEPDYGYHAVKLRGEFHA